MLLLRTVRIGFPLLLLSFSQPGKDQRPAGIPRRSRGAAAEVEKYVYQIVIMFNVRAVVV